MKQFVPCLLLAMLAISSMRAGAVSDNEVAARRVALEVAGAFSNDGFKLRDGSWSGQLQTGKSHVVQVNLYAGNQYWFSLGTSNGAKKVSVSIHDEKGQPVSSEPYAEGATAAAGFSPEASGPYFIKIQEIEGEPTSFCLVYSYK